MNGLIANMETVKVLVLGASKSGKTSLIARLINEKMPTVYRPTIETFSTTKHKTIVKDQGKLFQHNHIHGWL